MSDPSERATALAKAAAVAVAVTVAAWVGYVAIHPDAEAKRAAEVEVTVAGEWYNATGTITHGKRKLNPSEMAAAVDAGIVVKNCGTLKEHKTKCAADYPPELRCACCGHDADTDCAGGYLCRYGVLSDGNTLCDPDAPGCVDWPCVVIAGEAPLDIAAESSEEIP